MSKRVGRIAGLATAALLLVASLASAQSENRDANGAPVGLSPGLVGPAQTAPLSLAGGRIFQANGFGNTFLVKTAAGSVIIDTSNATAAPRHRRLLGSVNPGPIRAIFLTHAHNDHAGGLKVWKDPGTKVVAQANYVPFVNYQTRLTGFFRRRNAAQFGGAVLDGGGTNPGNYAGNIQADVLYEKQHTLKLGDLTFIANAAPGETPDHAFIWIPELKAAFIGDNYYDSFPNIYTLRGTETRHALDYVESINKVLALRPEIVLPSHGQPIVGDAKVQATLTRYRDAILYVHDAVVKGMNEGKDVYTLMREIKLPPQLEVGESYGAVTWSIRGIYEGYAGWFDTDPATMYAVSPGEAARELAGLAGGAGPVAARAEAAITAGNPELGLRLTSAALASEPGNAAAKAARTRALQLLLTRSKNSNESGWLRAGLAELGPRAAPNPGPAPAPR